MTEGVEWICQAYSGRIVELAEAFLIVISCQPAISLVAKLCCGFVSKVNYRDAGGLKISWDLKHVGSTQARQLLACQALCYVVIWGCSDEAVCAVYCTDDHTVM